MYLHNVSKSRKEFKKIVVSDRLQHWIRTKLQTKWNNVDEYWLLTKLCHSYLKKTFSTDFYSMITFSIFFLLKIILVEKHFMQKIGQRQTTMKNILKKQFSFTKLCETELSCTSVTQRWAMSAESGCWQCLLARPTQW